MFESVENRRRGPSLWKAFGITCSLFSLFVILYVHFRNAHDEDEAEARHDRSREAAARRDSPQRVERDGIAVEVPAEPTSQGDYRNGGMVGRSFEITWNLGAAWSDLESDHRAQDFAAKHLGFAFERTDVTTLGGAPARVYTLAHGERRIYLAYSSCAGRRVHVLAYDDKDVFDTLMKTFECRPDKAVDLARRDVVVDPVAGWKRIDPEERWLAVANHDGVKVTTMLLRREYDKPIADIVIPAATEVGLHLREPPATRNDKVMYTGYYDDQSSAYLLAFRCPDDDIGVAIVRGPKDKLNDGVALADTAHCLQYGEAMPTY